MKFDLNGRYLSAADPAVFRAVHRVAVVCFQHV